ncbi:MAG: SpoIIE family protein phosphatase [Phycisphaerales bacterium]|nr:MAG: SpoIIE family protein phosphatase [Phycisphaerales bacterium]
MTSHQTATGDRSESPELVLLVDDNPTNLQVLFQTLDGQGLKLLIAKSGETALNIARKNRPSLILLDIMMPPGIDGYETCRRLKADPDTSDAAVIFLSALDQTKDKVRGFEVGAVDYIPKPFQAEEVIARVNTHLTIRRLNRELQARHEEIERELKRVSDTQRRLLPGKLSDIPNMRIATYYETSRYAGGDYYDVIELPDGRWGLLIADAAGHSTPAAVLMAMTCAIMRTYPNAATDPPHVIKYLNEHLCKVSNQVFVTALYAVFDPLQRTLAFSSAGHPVPLQCDPADDTAEFLPCDPVFPLGLFPIEEVPMSELQLRPGQRLLFFTDGITERAGGNAQLYGMDRLRERFKTLEAAEPAKLIDQIMDDVNAFAGGMPSDDDQTLLLGVVD